MCKMQMEREMHAQDIAYMCDKPQLSKFKMHTAYHVSITSVHAYFEDVPFSFAHET